MDSGLEGVIAAETVLSHSDGERGILWVRGHALPELVAEHGYEGAVAVLWEGFAGNGLTRDGIRAELGAARGTAFARLASSRASLVSAALGAYCAFTGPLHGGAPGPTLDMLDEAEASGDIDAWIERKLTAGERLMGFGHRVFRPRRPARGRAAQGIAAPRPRRRTARLCRRGRAACSRGLCPAQAGPPGAQPECRDQRRAAARRRRNAARRLHPGVRGRPLRRLARPRNGAADNRPLDPSLLGLYRPNPA